MSSQPKTLSAGREGHPGAGWEQGGEHHCTGLLCDCAVGRHADWPAHAVPAHRGLWPLSGKPRSSCCWAPTMQPLKTCGPSSGCSALAVHQLHGRCATCLMFKPCNAAIQTHPRFPRAGPGGSGAVPVWHWVPPAGSRLHPEVPARHHRVPLVRPGPLRPARAAGASQSMHVIVRRLVGQPSLPGNAM